LKERPRANKRAIESNKGGEEVGVTELSLMFKITSGMIKMSYANNLPLCNEFADQFLLYVINGDGIGNVWPVGTCNFKAKLRGPQNNFINN
jgi:hypothetical protein